MSDFQPDPVILIDDLEAIKVLADPLRIQIMEMMEPAPITVGAVASKLGLSPNKLYYHVNMLEKHGLVKVVAEEVRGNLIEKSYRVTAFDYRLDKGLLNFGTPEGQENTITVFTSFLDQVREDIRRSLHARAYNLEHGAPPNPRQTLINRLNVRISDEQAAEFHQRLGDLVHDFAALDDPENADKQNWALNVMMYPAFYYEEFGPDTGGQT
jgi:DNA-binding transcriptional ArsR family regulator